MKNIILLFTSIFNLFSCQTSEKYYYENRFLSSGSFYINQKWSQEIAGYQREVFAMVPSEQKRKFPVVIVLHGNGGRANLFINEFKYLNNKIIIAPQGYKRSWNIKKEKSKAPDLNLIKDIILYLKQFDNVDSDKISILGSSNGAALVNQILIELNDPSIKNAISLVSQLNSFQYHNNKFWSQSNNNFNVSIIPQKGRRILFMGGTNDDLANYYGGEGVLGYVFLNAEESAYIFAKAMGYNGSKIPFNQAKEGPDNFFKFSYLNGDVIHYRLEGIGHSLGTISIDVRKKIVDFLNNY